MKRERPGGAQYVISVAMRVDVAVAFGLARDVQRVDMPQSRILQACLRAIADRNSATY